MNDMDFEDYESLPNNSTASVHMTAGALAGIMEHTVMYPVDSVKTRMQSLTPNPRASYRSIPEALYKMVRYEGALRPIRGMTAVISGAGPAHALYFSCYEQMKRVLSSTRPGHHHLAHGVSGCLATLLHDAIMGPADVIKQRMQMYGSPYSSCQDCIRRIYQAEGMRAFYRSYTTQLMMNVPFQSIHFMMYEFMQDVINNDRSYHPMAHVISGAVAGAFASAITTPLDVCKTLLNTQELRLPSNVSSQKHQPIDGLLTALRCVYRCRGLQGYFQGIQARVLFQMPSTAIAWSVYEFCKFFLSHHPQSTVKATIDSPAQR